MSLKVSKFFFLLLIVSIPLVRPFNVELFGLLVPFTDFIFLVSAAFWLISFCQGNVSLKWNPIYAFIGFYAIAFALSTIASNDRLTSSYKLLGEIYLFGLAILTFNIAHERGFFRLIAVAWGVGTGLTILASFTGIILFYAGLDSQSTNYLLSHFGSLPRGNYPRIRALFANANMMCNFLNVSLMLILIARRAGWFGQITSLLLSAGTWIAAFFTFSAGLGGMIVAVALWFRPILLFRGRPILSKVVLIAGTVLATGAIGLTLVSTDTENTAIGLDVPFVGITLEPSSRVLIWHNSIERFYSNPFFGNGVGLAAASTEYTTLSGEKQILTDAHNMWLNVAGQAGLFGLSAFVLLMAYVFSKCRFNPAQDGTNEMIRLGLSCAFAGTVLYQGLFGSFEDARHFWILIGLASASGEIDGSDKSISKIDA
ncbi:MAG: O-antigen ligase family protein [Pyrinomonadaceae bacterium]